MTTLHPRVRERLEAQLPHGSEIVDAVPNNDTSSKLVVIIGGGGGDRQNMEIIKSLISAHVGNTVIDLLVDDGASMSDVLREFSTRYNLFFIEGADYKETDEVVTFDEHGLVDYQLKIPETSILWNGEVTLRLSNKATYQLPSEPLTVPLDGPRVHLALTTKIFQGNGEVFTSSKKSLTAKFAKLVVGHLKECGISSLTAADIGGGEIIDVVCDGFSGMVVLKPKRGAHMFIRYRSKGEDIVSPSPGDVDPA